MNNGGPSPLVPSLLVGVFGLYLQGSTLASFLRFLVDILEQLFGEGEEEEEDDGGGDGPSPLMTTFLALSLIFLAIAMLVLMQVVAMIYKQSSAAIQRLGSPGHIIKGFEWGPLLLVILFVVLCKLV